MNHHFFRADALSRRAVPMGAIAALHFLVAYLLLTALVQPAGPPAPPVLTGRFLPEQANPPPQPPPDIRIPERHGPIEAPPVDDAVSSPPDPTTQALPAESAVDADGVRADAAPLPIRQVGSNVLPNSADYYPPTLIREHVQGATSLRVCVDAQGVRQGEAVIEQTAGNELLDRAALQMARHGRYARAMQGDRPVGNCYRFRITFRIPG
ncbi:MAG: energy transducer TonB [Proteobacteria bacterium]|nr:energy transducer TonB [Pseudomonadota bacterium]